VGDKMIKGVFGSISVFGAFVSNCFDSLYQGIFPTKIVESNPSDWLTENVEDDDNTIAMKRRKTTHKNTVKDMLLQPGPIFWQQPAQYQCQDVNKIMPLHFEKNQEEIPVSFISKSEYVKRNDPFQQFLDRIESTKHLSNSRLSKLISREDFLKICNYFALADNMESHQHQFGINTRSQNNHQNHIEKIRRLQPGESYRLPKEASGLARTLNILRSAGGEFKLLLETKSKLSNGKKQALPKVGGSFKSGKPAWRIDGNLTEYFDLVAEFEEDKQLNEIKSEVALSQELGSDTVNVNELGQVYEKHGVKKVSVYSVKAEGSLEDLLSDKVTLTAEQKHIMIKDLLSAVKRFHDNGYVHQDIKPGNILFIKNKQNEYRLKITDYGLSRKQYDPCEQALASAGYHSPEIALIHANTKSEYYNYFSSKDAKNSLGAWHANVMQPIRGLAAATPNKANDMWALGIVIYKILYGRAPLCSQRNSNIQNNPLLKGLLTANRKERINIDAAIEIHDQNIIIDDTPITSVRKRKQIS